jgi:hypothetical protein
MERILKYIETGKEEGAKVLTGGTENEVIKGGYYIKPTILRGTNDMKVFQEVRGKTYLSGIRWGGEACTRIPYGKRREDGRRH